MKKLYSILCAFLCVFSIYQKAIAQSGILDSDFDADGIRVDSLYPNSLCKGMSVAVQGDGKILVGGFADIQGDFDYYVIRFNTDGSRDNSFGSNGVFTYNFGSGTNDYAYTMALQTDGKIVLAGITPGQNPGNYIGLIRVNANGTLDQNFGAAGKVVVTGGDYLYPRSVAVDANSGRIVVLVDNWNKFLTCAFNANGSVDSTFGVNGRVSEPGVAGNNYTPRSVGIQSDGRIMVGGSTNVTATSVQSYYVIRYNVNGSRDNSFSVDGEVTTNMSSNTTDFAGAVLLQSDNKIVVTGGTHYSGQPWGVMGLVRYNPDGTLDLTFNGTGKGIFSYGPDDYSTYAITSQQDGKYIIAGSRVDTGGAQLEYFFVARINTDGSKDMSFGNQGFVTTHFPNFNVQGINSVAMQPDGRIVATGYVGPYDALSKIGTARYLSGLNLGIIEFAGKDALPLIYPNPVSVNETLKYALAKNEVVTINLYGMDGRLVSCLLSNAVRLAGEQSEQLILPDNIAHGNYLLKLSNAQGQAMAIQLIK